MKDSPCIAVCTTLYDDICRGCGRSAEEVAQWVTYSTEKKQAIMERLKCQQLQQESNALPVQERQK